MWSRKIVALLFVLAVIWGLFSFGSRELESYYRFFLLLAIPTVLSVFIQPSYQLRRGPFLTILLIGFALFCAIIINPIVRGEGFVIAAIGWMALYVTLVLTSGRQDTSRALFFILILAGGAEALLGLTQSLGTNEMVKGFFFNRNHFSGFLNMIIPLAIGALFANYSSRNQRRQSENWARAWIILLSLALMGLGILVSLSRMGTISLISTLIFLAILLTVSSSYTMQKSRKKRLSSSAIWVLLLMVLGLGAWVGMDELMVRFSQIEGFEIRRAVVYQDTLKLIADDPLRGVGVGMYKWKFRPYSTVRGGEWWDHAHNDYLETAAEWGIPLAMIFWGFVFWRMWRSIRIVFNAKDPWEAGIALGCVGAIFSIVLHSLVDFNLYVPANLAVFCTILGLSWTVDFGNRNKDFADR